MIQRRIIFTSILFLFIFTHTQSREKQNPFTFNASYVGDGVANMYGGIKTGAVYLGMGNITVSFDTEKARLWKGGELYLNGASIHGASPTEKLVGDFQVVDNIDGGNHSYMHEIWYKQAFGNFSFTAGLQDLNADFAVSENGGEYINSSFGISSLISNNIPAPIFPLTALGLSFQWDIAPHFSWLGAAFDGVPTDFDDNAYNLNWELKKDDGVLVFTEFQLPNLFKFADGTIKFGGYYHSKLVVENEETHEDETVFNKNFGFYLVADQNIKEWDNGCRLSAFIQGAVSPKDENAHNFYAGAGLNFYAPFKRKNDAVGLAVAHAGFHEGVHKHETAIEAFYKIQFTENISLQPDIQYVINPSGTDENLKNALVGILRFKLEF